MEVDMKECLNKEKGLVMEFILIQTKQDIKDSGIMVRLKEKGNVFGQTIVFMTDNGLIVENMAEVVISGKTEENMKELTEMT